MLYVYMYIVYKVYEQDMCNYAAKEFWVVELFDTFIISCISPCVFLCRFDAFSGKLPRQ